MTGVATKTAGSGAPARPVDVPARTVVEPEPELTPDQVFDATITRTLAAKLDRLGAKSGAFFLLGPGAPEWKKPHLVVDDEPDFEEEWRERVAHDKNPDHVFVVLPWG